MCTLYCIKSKHIKVKKIAGVYSSINTYVNKRLDDVNGDAINMTLEIKFQLYLCIRFAIKMGRKNINSSLVDNRHS